VIGIFEIIIAYSMTPCYSENQIRNLYAEFKSLKKYVEKLAFFDRWFGIIPFAFPDFDPQLRFFFQKEKTEELVDIFKKERNNPGLTEKKFSYGEIFAFNIKPANSNSSAYSHFILSCFLSRKPVFEEWIRQHRITENSVETFLDEANGIVNRIENHLQNEYDKSFQLQCMSVFYRGYYDAFTKRLNGPGKKRKFIELYLYAEGMIYADYISSLKAELRKSSNPVDAQKHVLLDLAGKLALLNKLGILDFLKKKYLGSEPVSSENELVETISLITGETLEQKEMILASLRKAQLANGTANYHQPASSGQIN
jgi:hypothetical protein